MSDQPNEQKPQVQPDAADPPKRPHAGDVYWCSSVAGIHGNGTTADHAAVTSSRVMSPDPEVDYVVHPAASPSQPSVAAEQQDRPTKQRRPSPLHPFRLLGYLLGAQSLLSLAEDLEVLKLYGHIQAWISAYSSLVEMLRSAVFGWIDWRWVGISTSEAHVLVVATVFSSALIRGLNRTVGRADTDDHDKVSRLRASFEELFTIAGVVGLVAVVPMLVLPGTGAAVAIGLLFTCGPLGLIILMFEPESTYDDRRSYKAVLYELTVVLGALAIIVVVNYAVFRPIEGG